MKGEEDLLISYNSNHLIILLTFGLCEFTAGQLWIRSAKRSDGTRDGLPHLAPLALLVRPPGRLYIENVMSKTMILEEANGIEQWYNARTDKNAPSDGDSRL